MKLQPLVTVPTTRRARSARPTALALALAGMLGCAPPRLALRAESVRTVKARPMKVVPWGTMDPLELGGGIAFEAAF